MLGFDDDEWMGWHNDIGSGQGVGGARAGNFDSSAPLMMQVGWDDNSARRNYTKNGVPWTENKGGRGGGGGGGTPHESQREAGNNGSIMGAADRLATGIPKTNLARTTANKQRS